MIAPRHPAAGFFVPIMAITIAILAAGCAAAATTTTRPAGSPAGSGPALTAVPGRLASPVPRVSPPTTTDTEFGTIFDSLPPSFPTLPGQEPADTGAGPTSGSFVATMSVGDARKIIEVSLISQGWAVQVGSPLEDGTVVLEATGDPAGCKTEVRLTPTSGTVLMSVLYGASCPFG